MVFSCDMGRNGSVDAILPVVLHIAARPRGGRHLVAYGYVPSSTIGRDRLKPQSFAVIHPKLGVVAPI